MSEYKEPFMMVMKFADAKVPEFKTDRYNNWVSYGTNGDWHNRYPDYLLHLYNKSAKHNAIINGKLTYIIGKGFTTDIPKATDWAKSVNDAGESLDQVMKKAALDVEIYGGCRLQVVPKKAGGYNLYHADFGKFRTSIDGKTFFYKNNWKGGSRETPIEYPAFYEGIEQASIIAYNEYRPGMDVYPLPGYLGANNYIETDIEISKYYLSAIQNGMIPSKLIQFFNGTPADEKKENIEKRFTKKFTGSENAGKIIIVFNDKKEHEVKIDDLSATDLDKHFQEMDKTVQQNIFSGHQITSPMLFGIKEAGQLGGTTELTNAYDIFKNTYVANKQANLEAFVKYFSGALGYPAEWKIQEVDPIGFQYADAGTLKGLVPDAWLFEKLGIDAEKYLPAPAPGATGEVNQALKALSGKENINLMRIIRQFGQGKINEQQARTMLRGGYGLSEEDMSTMLGIEAQFSTEEDVCMMFDSVGSSRADYTIIHSKPYDFKGTLQEFEQQLSFAMGFAETVDTKDKRILELIQKDTKVTVIDLATAIGDTEQEVTERINTMQEKGFIKGGEGSRVLTKPLSEIAKVPATSVQIRYSYEKKPGVSGAAIIPTSRPFCRKLIELDKMYSRAEIEQVSSRVGYSVFDRSGGFWNNDGTIETSCRHTWKVNLVYEKRKA
jgi:hypothetical protein